MSCEMHVKCIACRQHKKHPVPSCLRKDEYSAMKNGNVVVVLAL